MPFKLLTRKEASEFLGISPPSFDKAKKKSGFPSPTYILDTPKWVQADLEQYVEDSKTN